MTKIKKIKSYHKTLKNLIVKKLKQKQLKKLMQLKVVLRLI